MNPMDRVTLRGLVIWAVFIAAPLAAAAWVRRELRQRREDREWAAGVARAMKSKARTGPLLSDEEDQAFAVIVAHYNDVTLDEILDREGEEL